MFFGAVLTFIAADLMVDWLVRSRAKVHFAEYVTILLTFLFINLIGLELGMSAGVLVAMTHFILDYARVPVMQRVSLRSNVLRSIPLQNLLAQLQLKMITLKCRGYIFFGSTLQIMDEVLESVVLAPEHAAAYPNGLASAAKGQQRGKTTGDSMRREVSVSKGYSSTSSLSEWPVAPERGAEKPVVAPLRAASPTKFVLFDFTAVSGLDATAARSCFLNLCKTLAPFGITIVFGGVPPAGRIEALLLGHGILSSDPETPAALRFDTIDEALEFCEDSLLREAAQPAEIAPPPSPLRAAGGLESRQVATALSRVLSPLVESSWSDMLEGMAPFFEERVYDKGDLVFSRGEEAAALYLIVSGEVTLWSQGGSDAATVIRLVRYANGGIFGELDFFLRNRRSFSAEVSSASTRLLVLRRDALESMQSQASARAAALEHALLKYLCFTVNTKLGLSDGIGDVNRHA